MDIPHTARTMDFHGRRSLGLPLNDDDQQVVRFWSESGRFKGMPVKASASPQIVNWLRVAVLERSIQRRFDRCCHR